METAPWRAEVIVVARVLAQQILEERWDVYQPISVVEENLRRSEGQGTGLSVLVGCGVVGSDKRSELRVFPIFPVFPMK